MPDDREAHGLRPKMLQMPDWLHAFQAIVAGLFFGIGTATIEVEATGSGAIEVRCADGCDGQSDVLYGRLEAPAP